MTVNQHCPKHVGCCHDVFCIASLCTCPRRGVHFSLLSKCRVTDYLEVDLLQYHSCKKTKCVHYLEVLRYTDRPSTGVKKFHAPKYSPHAVNTKGRRKSSLKAHAHFNLLGVCMFRRPTLNCRGQR